jgi:hypothetical protein
MTKRYSLLLSLGISLVLSQNVWSQCSSTPVTEAVRNGNFEAGYLTKSGAGHVYTANGPFDFQSDLTSTSNFVANPPTGTCLWSIANMYAVGKAEPGMTCTASARQAFAGTDYINVNFNDHTPGLGGNGYALIGDFEGYSGGKWDTHASGLPCIWRQHVTIYPNEKYYFSAWFANYNRDAAGGGYNTPDLNFVVVPMISGVPQFGARANLGTATPTGQMNWQQFYGTWTPGAIYTEAMILIEVLTANATFTNDILLDDISFINGCTNLTSLPASVIPDLGNSISLCTTNGVATLNSNVATGGSTQFWWYSGTSTPQTTLVSASSSANTYAISAPGTYRVCVQNSSFPTGCSASSTIVVTNTMPPVVISDAVLCTATTTTLSTSVTGTGFTYDWYKRPSGAPTSTSSSITTGVVGTYGVRVTPGAGAQAIGCPQVTSNDAQVTSNISTPSIVSSNCTSAPNGTFTLSGTGGGNTFTWYDAASGGSVLATGNPAVINITGPRTVYVENSNTNTAAPTMATANGDDGGGGATWNSTNFVALQSFTLVSVWVRAACCGTSVTLNMTKDGVANQTSGAQTLTVGTWKEVILNWPITAGSTYVITYATAARLSIKTGHSSTTYSSMVTLNPNANGNSGAAFQWTLRTGSPCLRGPISLDCPLPVSLLSFEVSAAVSNSTLVSWSTSSEINNDYFIIERSFDGINFDAVGKVEGLGNSSQVNSYEFTDLQSTNGIVYYRLKQVDEDGTYLYSEIKSIFNGGSPGILLYPNPNQGSFTVFIPSEGEYRISLSDIVGKLLYESIVHTSVSKEHLLNTSLAKGTYLIQISSGNDLLTDKIIIE